jgi:hypothetical protein
MSSVATAVALAVGGYWTYQRFIRSREGAPKVDLDIDLSFIHKQGPRMVPNAPLCTSSRASFTIG